MHDCKAEAIVGQKSSQMGYTEWVLNLAFFYIDIRHENILYVLPNKMPDATDFSNARFNPALDLSNHLKNLFSDINNVGHKRAGNANLYVRGSKSRAGLKSIPVQVVVLDEVDEMDQENIPLALERVSGQPFKKTIAISTPTIENYGINLLFEQSDKRRFFFPCPSCSRHINLEFPRNIKIIGENPTDPIVNDSYYFCHLCQNKLVQEAKPEWLKPGTWVPEKTSTMTGYHINRMYSCPITPGQFVQKYLNGLTNQADEQEFYNSALGLPHAVEGSRVTDKQINSCIASYTMQSQFESHNQFVTMGVDVGKFLHVEICDWYWDEIDDIDPNRRAICKVIAVFKFRDWEELNYTIQKFNVRKCVIDINPERRMALNLVNQWYGRVEMCEYPVTHGGRNITVHEEDGRLQVDRTAWLDLSLGRFFNKTIALPRDIPYEYREEIKAQTKIFYKDKDGNPRAKYVHGSTQDHFGHARNYCEIAFARAAIIAGAKNISDPYQ